MKRLALGLLLGFALLAGCSRGTPKAIVPETSFDFGDVPVVTDMRKAQLKEFVIMNEGTGDLRLKEPQVKILDGC